MRLHWPVCCRSGDQPSAAAQQQQVQVIELNAKKYEYSPSPVHVKAGTKVQLKITAVDHDHGFKISPVPDGSTPGSNAGLIFTSPEDCGELGKGKTTVMEFVAQTPGTYLSSVATFAVWATAA